MATHPKTALLVIDLQNDYFADGAFPLWEAEFTLERCLVAVARAQAAAIPVFLIQHVADAGKGPAPFFNPGTPGVELHPRLLAQAPDAPVIIKHFADSFLGTTLDAELAARGIESMLIVGMMTQNCVTHTAISRQADAYRIRVLGDCCTTVSRMIHLIALNALAPRVEVSTLAAVLP